MAELNELKRYLQDEAERTLTRSKGGLYNCPLCGSGTGANKTGAFSIQGERWRCFACEQGGDIYDLYELRDGLTKSDAARAVKARYGQANPPARAVANPPAKPPANYAGEIARAAGLLAGSEGETYLKGRGLTLETMRRFSLGYSADEYNKPLKKRLASIVIPYPDANYYVTRPINEKAYDKPKGSSEPLFNQGALYGGAEAVFIVEAQLCAISIEQEGGAAIALGGAGITRLANQLKEKPTQAALVLALDNDETGQEKTATAAEKLTAAGVYHLQANIAGRYKDPNERLQHDAPGLRAAIKEAIEAALSARNADERAKADEYQAETAAAFIQAFTDGIAASIDTPAIPTGFKGLDDLLEGGLYEGLYIIGAISSLGKTTFALQVIDQIAASGHDVIVFSLEMARYELMAKSISRLTFEAHQAQGLPLGAAKTTRGITTGKRYANYNDTEMRLIERATKDYAEISRRIWIKEGIGELGVQQVREAVQRHITLTGRKPVVLIDYLQILAPYNERYTDKQNTDKAVLELKRISRDNKIPIIGISSFNRDNYTAPVNMAAFKESGAIEYSSDVLMGLQYTGMDYQEGEADKAREKRIRELIKDNEAAAKAGKGVAIDLKVLKNRNGGRGTSKPLTFYPMFNCFAEL